MPTDLAARLTSQLLSGPPAATPGEVVRRLLAVQAQDPQGARLAIRARTQGLHGGDVDRALDERELVVTWANRGTLHLVRSEDYPWLHALTTPQIAAGNASRLRQEGVSVQQAERGVRVVEQELGDGPRTRAQLRAALERKNVPVAGQALVHVLLLATLRGVCVRGPMRGSEQAFVLVRDWLPAAEPVERETALGELARRYLAGHAPATERDLAKWAGITLADARRGMEQVEQVPGEVHPLPPPRLLGPFDPLLHGWVSREAVLGEHADVVTVNGVFRPVALVKGRAVATWTVQSGKQPGALELHPFGRLTAAVRKALEKDAADVARFLAQPEASSACAAV